MLGYAPMTRLFLEADVHKLASRLRLDCYYKVFSV